MQKMATQNTGDHRRRATPYVLGWALLALVSMGYLATAAVKPDVLHGILSPTASFDEERKQIAENAATIRANSDSIGQMQAEITKIKTDLEAASERDTAISARIDLLDQKTTEEKPAPEANDAPAPRADASPRRESESHHGVPGVRVLNSPDLAEAARQPAPKSDAAEKKTAKHQPASSKIETGSVAKPSTASGGDVAFGPPVVKAAPKPVGIQIPTGQSIDALRQSWVALTQRHPSELRNLHPRYVTAGRNVDGQTYDLIAGPVKSAAEARRICKELSAQLVPCKVGNYAGNAL
jgi:hypothetical protein